MKQNFEGRCMEEYGYLIQILPMKAHDAKGGIKVSHIKVITEGCLALIQFDCLCFKRTSFVIQPGKVTSSTYLSIMLIQK